MEICPSVCGSSVLLVERLDNSAEQDVGSGGDSGLTDEVDFRVAVRWEQIYFDWVAGRANEWLHTSIVW